LENNLTEIYEHIWETFFPRFDRKKKWVAEYSDKIAGHGYCDRTNKKILVAKINNQIELKVTIIHELCHTVSSDYHGKIWCNRMSKASELAEKIGEKDFSAGLREVIQGYKKNRRFTAEEVYNRIEYCMIAAPQISFENLIAQLSGEFCITPEEFKKKYKRCKKVYEDKKNS